VWDRFVECIHEAVFAILAILYTRAAVASLLLLMLADAIPYEKPYNIARF